MNALIAEFGAMPLRQVGAALGVSHQRAKQIEKKAMASLARAIRRLPDHEREGLLDLIRAAAARGG